MEANFRKSNNYQVGTLGGDNRNYIVKEAVRRNSGIDTYKIVIERTHHMD